MTAIALGISNFKVCLAIWQGRLAVPKLSPFGAVGIGAMGCDCGEGRSGYIRGWSSLRWGQTSIGRGVDTMFGSAITPPRPNKIEGKRFDSSRALGASDQAFHRLVPRNWFSGSRRRHVCARCLRRASDVSFFAFQEEIGTVGMACIPILRYIFGDC